MASSTKNVEERPADTAEDRPSRAGGLSRRALLGLGALGAAAQAEAQVRTPTRSKPNTVPTGEMRLLRRVTVGVDDRGRGVDALARLLRLPRVAAQPRDDGRSRVRGAASAAHHDQPGALLPLRLPDSAVAIRELTEATITRAIYSNRQLLERMVEFWADHFNTNITSVGIFKMLEVRDVYRQARARHLRRHAECQRVEPRDAHVPEQYAERRAARAECRTRTTRASSWSSTRSASTAATRSRTSSRWRAASPAGARSSTPATRAPARSSTTPTGTTTTASSCSAFRLRLAAGSTTD